MTSEFSIRTLLSVVVATLNARAISFAEAFERVEAKILNSLFCAQTLNDGFANFTCAQYSQSNRFFLHFLICPFPSMTILCWLIPSNPLVRRTCNFCVEMPISPPSPIMNPSVKRVDAFQYTAAASI